MRDTAEAPQSSTIGTYLQELDADALRALVLELADRDEKTARLLELRATAEAGPDREVSAELASRVSAALKTRGFVDYRESYGVAQDAGCSTSLRRTWTTVRRTLSVPGCCAR